MFYCNPHGYKYLNRMHPEILTKPDGDVNTKQFMIINFLYLLIESLLSVIMIIISFFIEYDDYKLYVVTMIGFYHYIIFTLPYYKSYLLMKHLKWMQWSLLCDFIILQSNRSSHDIINRFYCCLHQLIYHNRDNPNDDELSDDTENVNLLMTHKSNNNCHNADIHERNDKHCIKLQSQFMNYNYNEKWRHLMDLLDDIKSNTPRIDERREYRKYINGLNQEPFHSNCCINYIYWISSLISLFFPFIWMPFIGDELYYHKGFFKLCIVIAIMEIILVISIWYVYFIMKFGYCLYQVTKILSNLEDIDFYPDDVFIAANMNKDMRLVHVVQDNIQLDIASVILSFLLDKTLHATRPRKRTIW